MNMKTISTAVMAFLLAGAAQGASIQLERFAGDATFNTRCGGGDNFGCEYVVAEGRAGNRSNTGTWERGLFNRINNTVANATADVGSDFGIANSFSLSYDGAGTSSLNYLGGPLTVSGIDFNTSYAGDNPTAPAQTLYLRVRDANLSDLELMTGGATHAVGSGLLTGIGAADPLYLVIGGFDVTAPWTLSGNALLGSGNNSGSAFQVKVTDVAPIPLPAAAWMLLSAMGGLGALCWRKRCAAA